MEVWKQFDKNLLSHSAAHHLMAIEELIDKHGYARVSDVARFLEITRGSVSITVKKLKERDLIQEDENRFLVLTERGRRLARSIAARHEVFQTFFVDILGVNTQQAGIDSCKIEHLVSPETCTRLMELIQFLHHDPQGQELLKHFRKFQSLCTTGEGCDSCEDSCLLESI